MSKQTLVFIFFFKKVSNFTRQNCNQYKELNESKMKLRKLDWVNLFQ